MPRTTHTPGKFRLLVGNFDGATDPSQNGILGKPTRTMSGYEIQPLYFSGNPGNGMDLNGSSLSGNIATTAPSRAAASFIVNNATITSTLYLQIADMGVGTFNLTFSGAPAISAPITLIGIAAGATTTAAATNAKTAIDANATLAALFSTTVQANTPVAGTSRLAIVAKALGSVCNNVTLSITPPGGGTPNYTTVNASFSASSQFSGGDTDPNRMVIGDVTFNSDFALSGIVGYPALVNDTATRQSVAAALATAISNIPQFSASTGGGTTVSILGPSGPDGGTYPFRIFQSGLVNYTSITPSTGFFAVGAPTITGPTLS